MVGGDVSPATAPARRARRWTLLPATLAALPALALWVLSLRLGRLLNLFESGTVVEGGLRILSGQVPYRDFFSFYGPLTYLIPGLAMTATGSVPVGVFGVDLLLALGMSVVVYALAFAVSNRPWLSLIAPLSIALVGATDGRTLPALVGVWCFAKAERTKRLGWLVGTGVAWGLAVLWVQDTGAWLGVALVLVLVMGRWLDPSHTLLGWPGLRRLALGFGLVVAPWLVWLLANGALDDWFYWNFVFPNTTYGERSATGYLVGEVASWTGSSPAVWLYKATFYLMPYVAIVVLALVNLIIAFSGARRGNSRSPITTLLLALFAALVLRVLLASVDDAKLAVTAAPTIGLTVGLAARALARGGSRRRPLTKVVAVAALAWLLVWPLQRTTHTLTHWDGDPASGSGRLAGLPFTAGSTSVGDLARLQAIVAERTGRGDPILVLPTAPMLYAITDRQPATRWDYLDPVYTTPDVDAQIAQAVTARVPRLVLLNDIAFPGSAKRGPDLAPATYSALAAGYRPVETVGAWTVLAPP